MLYPAELRAPAGSITRVDRTGLPTTKRRRWSERHLCSCLRRGSETGMPTAVLADVGGRTLRTCVIRGTVVVGEGAGQRPRPVIVLVADLVGQPVIANMVLVSSRLRQARRNGQGGQDDGCSQFQVGHYVISKKNHSRRSVASIRP